MKRSSGSPILLKIVSENRISRKTYFYTIASRVIEKEMSEEVAALFENKTALVHPGGHFVPANSRNKRAYLDFLEERKKEMS